MLLMRHASAYHCLSLPITRINYCVSCDAAVPVESSHPCRMQAEVRMSMSRYVVTVVTVVTAVTVVTVSRPPLLLFATAAGNLIRYGQPKIPEPLRDFRLRHKRALQEVEPVQRGLECGSSATVGRPTATWTHMMHGRPRLSLRMSC